ncbi:MAG TPA: hypothetical protein VM737_09190 [Gemmatimonadota bacterium]|nr:hypothetical protein [Gemmatimonadota bacterium]
MIAVGQEGILVASTPIAIHGDVYLDVVIGDPQDPADLARHLRARLGPEAIAGDPVPGDRVRVQGFLRMVTGISRIE